MAASLSSHAILVVAKAGEHLECLCGGWRFDSDHVLDVEELQPVIASWDKHVVESVTEP